MRNQRQGYGYGREQDMSILFMMDLCGSFAAVITESVAAVKSFIQVKHDPFDNYKGDKMAKMDKLQLSQFAVCSCSDEINYVGDDDRRKVGWREKKTKESTC